MTTRIRVTTDFDCTNTGVTGHFKPSKLPFRDHADQLIEAAKHNVTANYIKKFRDKGFKNLTLEDYVKMKKYDLDPEFIKEMNSEY